MASDDAANMTAIKVPSNLDFSTDLCAFWTLGSFFTNQATNSAFDWSRSSALKNARGPCLSSRFPIVPRDMIMYSSYTVIALATR